MQSSSRSRLRCTKVQLSSTKTTQSVSRNGLTLNSSMWKLLPKTVPRRRKRPRPSSRTPQKATLLPAIPPLKELAPHLLQPLLDVRAPHLHLRLLVVRTTLLLLLGLYARTSRRPRRCLDVRTHRLHRLRLLIFFNTTTQCPRRVP